MARVTLAMLWLVAAGSAHAAYMKGTLTLDDGRTATLTLRRFVRTASHNEGGRGAIFRCSGDACLGGPRGDCGFETPFAGAYDLAFFETSSSSGLYDCTTGEVGLKPPGACHIESRVTCWVEDTHLNPIIQVVATGMLDVHRTTPSCRRKLRRAGQ